VPRPYKAKLTIEIPEEQHLYLRGLPHGAKAALYREFTRFLVDVYEREGDMAVVKIASGIKGIVTITDETVT
jgi:hypothetical protein